MTRPCSLVLLLLSVLGGVLGADEISPWHDKLDKLNTTTANKLYGTAVWALSKNLIREGTDMLELALEFNPNHERAQKKFKAVATREPVSTEPKNIEKWQAKKLAHNNYLKKKWTSFRSWAEKKKYAEAVKEADSALDKLFKSASGPSLKRSRKEVLELIEKAGTSDPNWFKDVKLKIPSTLKLDWPEAKGGWNANVNPGQYLWSRVNENPAQWKVGTRVMHKLAEHNANKPGTLNKAQNALGHCYHDLLRDWARGAYWWSQGQLSEGIYNISYADCFWQLGCKELAVEKLSSINYDSTRYGSAVKLWADLGEMDKAKALAKTSGTAGTKRALGDACRNAGLWDESIKWYDEVAKIPVTGKNDILVRNKEGSKQMKSSLWLFKNFDLSIVKSGTYTGTAKGYQKNIDVKVVVRQGVIKSVDVTKQAEKQHYSSLWDIPEKIIKKQSIVGIQGTTGATVSAEAVLLATARALGKGRPKKK